MAKTTERGGSNWEVKTMLLRLICIATLLCTDACTPRAPAPSHPLRWARAWIDSLNSHRWQQVGPLLGEQGRYEDSLLNGPLDPVQAAFYWDRVWTTFPELRYQLNRVTGDGWVVAVEWSAEGLGAAEPPSHGIFILTLDGDSIASVRGYYDAAPFLMRRPR